MPEKGQDYERLNPKASFGQFVIISDSSENFLICVFLTRSVVGVEEQPSRGPGKLTES